jgi:hypothetical protein
MSSDLETKIKAAMADPQNLGEMPDGWPQEIVRKSGAAG